MRRGLERAAKPIVAAVIALVVVIAVVTTCHWIEVGDSLRVAGSIIGISIVLLIFISAFVFWVLYWLPLTRAVREVSRVKVGEWVMGGRIPRLADDERARAWPTQLGVIPRPQLVVAVFTAAGTMIYDTRRHPEQIVDLSWSRVSAVVAAEYVEDGSAYDGFAIVGTSEDTAVVLQLVRASGPVVGFIVGAELQAFAATAEALRAAAPVTGAA